MMAVAPSPVAAETRWVMPRRTSPAAKMPGTLVSCMKGSRLSGQPLGGFPSVIRSRPVMM